MTLSFFIMQKKCCTLDSTYNSIPPDTPAKNIYKGICKWIYEYINIAIAIIINLPLIYI